MYLRYLQYLHAVVEQRVEFHPVHIPALARDLEQDVLDEAGPDLGVGMVAGPLEPVAGTLHIAEEGEEGGDRDGEGVLHVEALGMGEDLPGAHIGLVHMDELVHELDQEGGSHHVGIGLPGLAPLNGGFVRLVLFLWLGPPDHLRELPVRLEMQEALGVAAEHMGKLVQHDEGAAQVGEGPGGEGADGVG